MAGSIHEALQEAWTDIESDTDNVERDHSITPIVDDAPAIESLDSSREAKGTVDAVEGDEQVVRPLEERKTPATAKPVQKAGAKPAAQPNTPAAPTVKAPQSWKPAMREHFATLNPEVQQEIVRREAETSKVLSESANARKFAESFTQTIRPFEGLIAASGVQPIAAIKNLMSTAATLQTGTQAQRAQTVANIIKAYGVDIATLDAVLTGQKPPPNVANQDAIQRAIDARMAPFQQEMQQRKQQEQLQAQQVQQAAGQSIEAFAGDAQNEYYEDLREDMADLLDMAAQRGRLMTIKEAYDRAAAAHPEISKLLAKKQAIAKATQSRGSVDRARRAASSQGNGSPGAIGGKPAAPKGIRGAVSQAWDELSA